MSDDLICALPPPGFTRLAYRTPMQFSVIPYARLRRPALNGHEVLNKHQLIIFNP